MKFIDLFDFDSQKFILKDINYHLIDEKEVEGNITCNDNIEDVEMNSNKLFVSTTRHLHYNNLFDLTICYIAITSVKSEYYEEFDISKYNIKQEVDNHKDAFSGFMLSKVSKLISEITTFDELVPLITPPMFTND